MTPRRSRLPPWTLRDTDPPDYESLALDALLSVMSNTESPMESPERRMPPESTTRVVSLRAERARGGEHVHDSLELLGLWRQFLVSTLSTSSVGDYWGAVRRFTFALPVPIVDVSEDHLTGYLSGFPPRSNARVGAYQALRHLFGWLHRRGFVGSDPTEHLRVQAPMERVPTALTEEQLTRIVYASAVRTPFRGYAVSLLYYTAARVSEACALRWSDVREGQLRIQGFKGGRERWVPVGPGLRGTLDGLGETGTHRELLIGRCTATVWKWVKDAGEATGIPNVHPHLFRATAATILMRRGARPDVVRLYLGHTNLRTTLRYLAVDQTELADAGALL